MPGSAEQALATDRFNMEFSRLLPTSLPLSPRGSPPIVPLPVSTSASTNAPLCLARPCSWKPGPPAHSVTTFPASATSRHLPPSTQHRGPRADSSGLVSEAQPGQAAGPHRPPGPCLRGGGRSLARRASEPRPSSVRRGCRAKALPPRQLVAPRTGVAAGPAVPVLG